MALSNQTQVLAIDPITFNNSRAVFELPDDYYVSDSMVIANLGMVASTVALNNTVAAFYPVTCGVGQTISRFTLESGSDEIEFLDHVPQWLSLQSIKGTYSVSQDKNASTLHSAWGFSFHPDQTVLGTAANTAGQLLTLSGSRTDAYTAFNTAGSAAPYNSSRLSNAQYAPGSSGALPVKMLSGLLRSVPILPRIPKLRIIIEYDTNVAHYFTPATGTAPPSLIPTFPMLLVQKLLNPPSQGAVVNLPYTRTICDGGMVVPAWAGAVGTTQSLTYQSYSFTSKLLRNMRFYDVPAAAGTTFMTQQIRSPGQADETLQMLINGEKYIPDTGIDTPARKMQYLIGTDGNMCLPMSCMVYNMFNQNAICPTATQPIIGNLSVTAVNVNAPVNTQIQVQYSRKRVAGNTADQIGAINKLIYGDISQVLSIAGGRSQIAVAS